MRKYNSTLVAGFGAAVLSIVPILKNFSFILIVPLAAVISLYLDKNVNKNYNKIKISKAILFGFMTGLFATLFFVTFDLFITFLTKTNDFVQTLPEAQKTIKEMKLGKYVEESIELMLQMADEIREKGFSLLYTALMFLSNFITNSIFGIIGGLLGMISINRKIQETEK
jgi:predicted PurR-regulated permease PerM